jgi:hypothetical protein
MTQAKQWNAEALELLLAAQGIRLAPGRAERLAAAMNQSDVSDSMRDALELDIDPTTYALVRERCKAK